MQIIGQTFNLNHSAMPRLSVEITQTAIAGGIRNREYGILSCKGHDKLSLGEFLHSQLGAASLA